MGFPGDGVFCCCVGWWCGLVIVLRVCFFGAGFACMLFIV